MMVCPECLSRDMVKFGKYNNKQRWRCMNCGLVTISPRIRKAKKQKEKEIKSEFN